MIKVINCHYAMLVYDKSHKQLFCCARLRIQSKGTSWSWSYGSWIYNYLCNQGLSALMLWVRIALRWGVIDPTLCDKVCQRLAAGWWFSLGTPVSSTNKTERHDITEILLKVALNTITLSLPKKNHIWYLGSHIRLFA